MTDFNQFDNTTRKHKTENDNERDREEKKDQSKQRPKDKSMTAFLATLLTQKNAAAPIWNPVRYRSVFFVALRRFHFGRASPLTSSIPIES